MKERSADDPIIAQDRRDRRRHRRADRRGGAAPAGFDVDVYEQAPELTEVGGGINMAPNATRVLRRLGLGEGLDREGVRPVGTHQRRWQDGRTLQRAPLNPLCEELYGAPHMTIHRADLLAVIAAGFPGRAHPSRPSPRRPCRQGRTGRGWFDNGVRITADVLVGADGIHSTVRAALFGEEAPAVCRLRRLSRAGAGRAHRRSRARARQPVLGRPRRPFRALFRVARAAAQFRRLDRARRTGTARTGPTAPRSPARSPPSRAGTSRSERIIAAAETCFIWALFDRDPLPRWSVGRTTLLGDACHPMYPFMGQGAAMAIEDGAALAACLGGVADPAAALRHYERLRLPRVTRLQQMSRANKIRFHMRDGPEQKARDAEWARAGDRSPDALRWLYATTLPGTRERDWQGRGLGMILQIS